MENHNVRPSQDIEVSIFNNNLKKILEDVGEALFDTLFEDGLLKEIPIVGTTIGLYKTGKSFKLRNYIKKILKFLNELKEITPEERENFLNKINKNPKEKKDLFERSLYILEKIDDSYKVEIIGRLFSNYVL